MDKVCIQQMFTECPLWAGTGPDVEVASLWRSSQCGGGKNRKTQSHPHPVTCARLEGGGGNLGSILSCFDELGQVTSPL